MRFDKTKKGYHAVWESGGGLSNRGQSTIVCDSNGLPKIPVYIKRKGHLACSDHALFILNLNDIIIDAYHHRGDFEIDIYQITYLNKNSDVPIYEKINNFSNGEWDNEEMINNLKNAIDAAKQKAKSYHCRTCVFFKDKESEKSEESQN